MCFTFRLLRTSFIILFTFSSPLSVSSYTGSPYLGKISPINKSATVLAFLSATESASGQFLLCKYYMQGSLRTVRTDPCLPFRSENSGYSPLLMMPFPVSYSASGTPHNNKNIVGDLIIQPGSVIISSFQIIGFIKPHMPQFLLTLLQYFQS